MLAWRGIGRSNFNRGLHNDNVDSKDIKITISNMESTVDINKLCIYINKETFWGDFSCLIIIIFSIYIVLKCHFNYFVLYIYISYITLDICTSSLLTLLNNDA